MVGLLTLLLVAGSGLLVPVGQPAPALEGRTLDGRAWSDTVTGEITIVEFFATWCPQCRHSLADEHKLAAARQVRLIIVDVDEDPLLVQDFFTRHPPPAGAGVLIDQSGSARANWGVTGFPAVFLVDKRDHSQVVHRVGRGQREPPGEADRLAAGRRAARRCRRRRREASRDRSSRSRQAAPLRDRAVSPDEHARQLGVEVLR